MLLGYITSHGGEGKPNQFEHWQAKTEAEGGDIVVATIVRLAADGLVYSELIDNQLVPAELKPQILDRLNSLLELDE